MAEDLTLTECEIGLVRDSWEEYNKGDLVDQGVHMFLRIFEQHPELKHLWRFSEQSDTHDVYKKSPRLRFHVKRLFATVGMIVDGLNQPEDLKEELEDLGKRHNKYGVTTKHHGAVSDGLLYALSLALGNKFTPETSKAWVKLYGWLEVIMSKTMNKS